MTIAKNEETIPLSCIITDLNWMGFDPPVSTNQFKKYSSKIALNKKQPSFSTLFTMQYETLVTIISDNIQGQKNLQSVLIWRSCNDGIRET